jgi:hypothetical protein
MSKPLAAVAALVVVCGLAMGQTKPPAYTVKDGIAEWAAQPGKDMNSIWTAIQKVLIGMKWSTDIIEKDSWKITAHQAHGSFATIGKDEADMPRVEITLIEGAVPTLMGRWYIAGSGFKFGWGSTKKKFYQKFFLKLEEELAK